jgi:hypothetical protein
MMKKSSPHKPDKGYNIFLHSTVFITIYKILLSNVRFIGAQYGANHIKYIKDWYQFVLPVQLPVALYNLR